MADQHRDVVADPYPTDTPVTIEDFERHRDFYLRVMYFERPGTPAYREARIWANEMIWAIARLLGHGVRRTGPDQAGAGAQPGGR